MEDYSKAIEVVKEMVEKGEKVQELKELITKYEKESEKK